MEPRLSHGSGERGRSSRAGRGLFEADERVRAGRLDGAVGALPQHGVRGDRSAAEDLRERDVERTDLRRIPRRRRVALLLADSVVLRGEIAPRVPDGVRQPHVLREQQQGADELQQSSRVSVQCAWHSKGVTMRSRAYISAGIADCHALPAGEDLRDIGLVCVPRRQQRREHTYRQRARNDPQLVHAPGKPGDAGLLEAK